MPQSAVGSGKNDGTSPGELVCDLAYRKDFAQCGDDRGIACLTLLSGRRCLVSPSYSRRMWIGANALLGSWHVMAEGGRPWISDRIRALGTSR